MDGKRLLKVATAVSAVAALAGPSTAVAVPCPPDQTVAALDQYCESLLTPVGVAAPAEAGPDAVRARPLSVALPRTEVELLRAAGPAAKALLLLPAVAPLARGQDTPAERRRARAGARSVLASGQLDAKEGDVRGFTTGLASAAGDVVGGAFRWGLVICSLGLTGMTWFRFRSRLRL
ncbi:MAG: hypothetical protein QOC68_2375 [Solirubrobacteraceae bacterium]|nr:hypothetical protein [Solirubrobacteraceae bacterium]